MNVAQTVYIYEKSGVWRLGQSPWAQSRVWVNQSWFRAPQTLGRMRGTVCECFSLEPRGWLGGPHADWLQEKAQWIFCLIRSTQTTGGMFKLQCPRCVGPVGSQHQGGWQQLVLYLEDLGGERNWSCIFQPLKQDLFFFFTSASTSLSIFF